MPSRGTPLADADRSALRDEVVAALRRGELCALPTETVYGVAAMPSAPGAEERLRRWRGDGDRGPATLHVADRADLAARSLRTHVGAERLMDRYWPGPLTLLLAGKRDEEVAVRQPAHAFTREVIQACGEPLWLTSIPDRTGTAMTDPAIIAARLQDDITLRVDDGESPLGAMSTLVRAIGPELEVLREGILSRAEVLQAAADLILFVCTGNTCRSPLAEAFARAATAQAMGVHEDRVLARGLRFASAGTAAMPGMQASEGSLEAGAEVGVDLAAHRSQPFDPSMLLRAVKIYCLSDSHRNALLATAPDAADRVELLRPDGADIADPFGGDLDIYRAARDEIAAAVQARAAEWWP